MDSPDPPPLPNMPAAPPAPTMFGEQRPGQKKKPKPKGMQPTFLGSEQQANPSNTGVKTLLGT